MERISELMDGELEGREAQRQLARLKQDQELAHCWSTFHLIGDALRGERPLTREISSRVAQLLADEPTVLAPRSFAPTKRAATYAVSVAASLSAVALVAWIGFFNNPLAPKQEIAEAPPASPPAAVVSTELASVPSEGQVNDLLRAHTEYSPSTAIQGLAPYIRSVSGTQQAKGR
ncbi:MAG TPA: sigma-E factor negative regulatory protein [Burkholderiales bacterium]|nr:sigma-E factor negative regulatory protein [Burkholderiales bacterium]